MTLELFLTLAAVFACVAWLSGVLLWRLFSRTSPERRRLEATERSLTSGILLNAPLVDHGPDPLMARLSSLGPRSPRDVSRLRRRMIRAGHHSNSAIAVYTAAQVVCVALGVAIPALLLPMRSAWPLALAGAVMGFQLPSMILQHQITKRQTVIRNGLPDALDLMIVCLESGSALDQSIVKVSDELQIAYPALAEELAMLVTETRAGKPRLEAFRNLADRTGLEDVRALVALLVQTDRFGTSVAQALRTHAETSRTKRRQRAEEAAAKIGVKLAFPLVLCLFPAFFIVTLGPAVIQFARVFYGQMLSQ